MNVNTASIAKGSTASSWKELDTANYDKLDQGGEDLASRRSLLVIDSRALERQCLAFSIATHRKDIDVLGFASVAEWKSRRNEFPSPAAILLNIGGQQITVPAVAEEIRLICATNDLPIILLADSDDLLQVFNALECGVKGYIPSSVSLDVCVEAICLSMAGGIFVPAGSVLAMRSAINKLAARPLSDMFTDRQLEVAEALRRGKANKIIAYELNMQESTVKVHVRNIMKKVKASNRTEVAYKLTELLPQ